MLMYEITDRRTRGVSRVVSTPEEISAVVQKWFGDAAAANGIPYYIEVQGWAELACLGELYEAPEFFVGVYDPEEKEEQFCD